MNISYYIYPALNLYIRIFFFLIMFSCSGNEICVPKIVNICGIDKESFYACYSDISNGACTGAAVGYTKLFYGNEKNCDEFCAEYEDQNNQCIIDGGN